MLSKVRRLYAEAGFQGVSRRGLAKIQWGLRAPFASLYEIGARRGTDKVNPFPIHRAFSYLSVYERYFQPLRNRPINLLEIGVLNGSSLLTWKTYFRKGRIFGLDIDPRCKAFETNRVSITIGSQADERVLEEVVRKAGHFDIIIDDGSHVNRHMLKSFEHLFPRLRPGGFYAFEDLEESYQRLDDDGLRTVWPGMHYNAPTDDLNNERRDLDEFFVKALHDIDHGRGEILSMQFWPYVCMILKLPSGGRDGS